MRTVPETGHRFLTIRPVPYPLTRTKAEWEAFLSDLYGRWRNTWANPVDQTAPGYFTVWPTGSPDEG